jgi:hypothetical protein
MHHEWTHADFFNVVCDFKLELAEIAEKVCDALFEGFQNGLFLLVRRRNCLACTNHLCVTRPRRHRKDVSTHKLVVVFVHHPIRKDALDFVHLVPVFEVKASAKLLRRQLFSEETGRLNLGVSFLDHVRIVLHVLGGLFFEVKS